MEKSAIYIDLKANTKKKDIKSILSKICTNFKYYHKATEALNIIKTAINSSKKEWGLVILDVRSVDKAPEVTQNFMKWIQEYYITQRLMLIYDKGLEKQLPDMCNYNIDFLIPDPWNIKLIERVVGRLKRDIQESEEKCTINNINENKYVLEDYEKYKKFAETQMSFFLSKSQKLDNIIKNIKDINNILLQIDYDDKNKDLIKKLFRNTEKLEYTNNTIVEFVKKYTIENNEEDYFDLNILLKVINTELEDELIKKNIDLVYKISNNVPSKLLGKTSVIKNVIIESIMLLILDAINEKLILSIDTLGNDNNLKLKISFRLSKSITKEINKSISKLEHNSQTYKISKIINEYGGEIIFTPSHEEILTLIFPTKIKDKRSYRLPKKDLMHKKVLIIYNDLDISASLKEMLEYFHFIVENAYTLDSAIRYINNSQYDIIYIQFDLSKDIIDNLKSRGVKSKIVAMLNNSDKKIDMVNFDAVICQPYTQQSVFDSILDVYYNESTYLVQEAIDAYKNYIRLIAMGKKTIIISKEYTDRISIELMLENSGLSLSIFKNIDEAIEYLPDSEILIICLDNIIENMNNMKLLIEYISNYNMENKTIGLISKQNNNLIEITKMTAIKNILKKPINAEQFYRTLTNNILLEEHE